MMGETQSAFFDRASRALRKQIPSINRRTIEILRLWRISPNASELNQKAASQFPKAEYTHFGPRCVFLEHTVPASGDGSRQEIRYDRKALEKLVDWANYRIRNTETFAAISEGHTPSNEEKAAGHQMPDVLGYSGPFYIGLLGDVDPKWAVYAEEWVHNGDLDRFKKLQRRSPEVWCSEPMEKRTMDPIAALGSETPRLDSGMNPYSRAGDNQLVMKYSASGGPSVGSVSYAADSKVEKTMHEFKEGELHSGSKKGPTVTNPKQAIAIALNQARDAGAKIPKAPAKYATGPAVMPGPSNVFIPSAGKKRTKTTRYGESAMAFQPAAPEENDEDSKIAEAIQKTFIGLLPSFIEGVKKELSTAPEDAEMEEGAGEEDIPRGMETEDVPEQESQDTPAPGGDEDVPKPEGDKNEMYGGDCNRAYAAGMADAKGKYSRSSAIDADVHKTVASLKSRLDKTESELATERQARQDVERYGRLRELNATHNFELQEEFEYCKEMAPEQFDRHCDKTIVKYSKRDDILDFALVGTEPDKYSRGNGDGKKPTQSQMAEMSKEAAERAARHNYAKPRDKTTHAAQLEAIVKERGFAV